ncbi:hypothetical protein PoB_001783600 [Plakobranchus ocellatus]|uniref:Uncharacterized protein n=1 Tax=Plakobranchus ocellatus TaxID=259542 RepID=A0AAV3Z9K3_9GAST|nr:hypothetical protein PoB_001783600 [Plakobranchus ocellatus]
MACANVPRPSSQDSDFDTIIAGSNGSECDLDLSSDEDEPNGAQVASTFRKEQTLPLVCVAPLQLIRELMGPSSDLNEPSPPPSSSQNKKTDHQRSFWKRPEKKNSGGSPSKLSVPNGNSMMMRSGSDDEESNAYSGVDSNSRLIDSPSGYRILGTLWHRWFKRRENPQPATPMNFTNKRSNQHVPINECNVLMMSSQSSPGEGHGEGQRGHMDRVNMNIADLDVAPVGVESTCVADSGCVGQGGEIAAQESDLDETGGKAEANVSLDCPAGLSELAVSMESEAGCGAPQCDSLSSYIQMDVVSSDSQHNSGLAEGFRPANTDFVAMRVEQCTIGFSKAQHSPSVTSNEPSSESSQGRAATLGLLPSDDDTGALSLNTGTSSSSDCLETAKSKLSAGHTNDLQEGKIEKPSQAQFLKEQSISPKPDKLNKHSCNDRAPSPNFQHVTNVNNVPPTQSDYVSVTSALVHGADNLTPMILTGHISSTQPSTILTDLVCDSSPQNIESDVPSSRIEIDVTNASETSQLSMCSSTGYISNALPRATIPNVSSVISPPRFCNTPYSPNEADHTVVSSPVVSDSGNRNNSTSANETVDFSHESPNVTDPFNTPDTANETVNISHTSPIVIDSLNGNMQPLADSMDYISHTSPVFLDPSNSNSGTSSLAKTSDYISQKPQPLNDPTNVLDTPASASNADNRPQKSSTLKVQSSDGASSSAYNTDYISHTTPILKVQSSDDTPSSANNANYISHTSSILNVQPNDDTSSSANNTDYISHTSPILNVQPNDDTSSSANNTDYISHTLPILNVQPNDDTSSSANNTDNISHTLPILNVQPNDDTSSSTNNTDYISHTSPILNTSDQLQSLMDKQYATRNILCQNGNYSPWNVKLS